MVTADQLRSIAALWKSTRRELVTSFSGVSMLPTIRPGQNVMLRCGEDIAIGDVVVFFSREDLLVHRVIAVAPSHSWWLTRGDANTLCDPPILRRDSIIGWITAVQHESGKFEPVPPHRPSRAARGAAILAVTAMRLNPAVGTWLLGLAVPIRRLLVAGYSRLRDARPQ